MNQGKYIFSQLMELVSAKSFQTIVNRHNGEYKVKEFSQMSGILVKRQLHYRLE